ncbi:Rv1733c family protein [Amycolatopsis sp. NPDC054798]
MKASADRVVRWWHMLVPGRGSVARPSDRIQSGLLLVAVLVGLAAVPFAAAAGSELYATQKPVSAEQTAQRSVTTAQLLADGPATTVSGRSGVVANSAPTDAVWQVPDGSRRVGKVAADEGARRGDRITIWVDRAGNPVPPPLSAAAVLVDAVCAALGLWVSVCLLLALVYGGTVFALNRHRMAEWQREWDAEREKRAHS